MVVKLSKERQDTIVEKIVAHIHSKSMVSLFEIQDRVKEKEWFSESNWDSVQKALLKHDKVSVSVREHDQEVFLRKKQVQAWRAEKKETLEKETRLRNARLRDMYPEEDIRPEDIPFKVCHCAQLHVHRHNSMGHWPDCDAIRFAADYAEQNPWDNTVNKLIDQEAYGKERARHTAVNNSRTRKPKHLLLATQQQRDVQPPLG